MGTARTVPTYVPNVPPDYLEHGAMKHKHPNQDGVNINLALLPMPASMVLCGALLYYGAMGKSSPFILPGLVPIIELTFDLSFLLSRANQAVSLGHSSLSAFRSGASLCQL